MAECPGAVKAFENAVADVLQCPAPGRTRRATRRLPAQRRVTESRQLKVTN
jgi:hypothetical protein